MKLRIKNPGKTVFVLPREDIGEPDLVIPAGEERESPPCKWLTKLCGRGTLLDVTPYDKNPPAVPENLRPQWQPDRICKQIAKSTGKRCRRPALPGSDFCAAHQPK